MATVADAFEAYLNKICKINVSFVSYPLAMRIVELRPAYVACERRDGRRIMISRDAILAVEALPGQEA